MENQRRLRRLASRLEDNDALTVLLEIDSHVSESRAFTSRPDETTAPIAKISRRGVSGAGLELLNEAMATRAGREG